MTTPITPCLWFDGRAQEAAEFYVGIFPDSRITGVQKVQDDDHPTGLPVGAVPAVSFELEGRPFFALNGGPGFPFTQAVAFQTYPRTQDDLDARPGPHPHRRPPLPDHRLRPPRHPQRRPVGRPRRESAHRRSHRTHGRPGRAPHRRRH